MCDFTTCFDTLALFHLLNIIKRVFSNLSAAELAETFESRDLPSDNLLAPFGEETLGLRGPSAISVYKVMNGIP